MTARAPRPLSYNTIVTLPDGRQVTGLVSARDESLRWRSEDEMRQRARELAAEYFGLRHIQGSVDLTPEGA
jgi:hypothetical protein